MISSIITGRELQSHTVTCMWWHQKCPDDDEINSLSIVKCTMRQLPMVAGHCPWGGHTDRNIHWVSKETAPWKVWYLLQRSVDKECVARMTCLYKNNGAVSCVGGNICTRYFDTKLHGILPWANINRNYNTFFLLRLSVCNIPKIRFVGPSAEAGGRRTDGRKARKYI